MSEVKDPTIKLFGKTIQLLPQQNYENIISSSTNNKDPIHNTPMTSEEEFIKSEEKVEFINDDPGTPNFDKESSTVDLTDQATSSGMSEDPKATSSGMSEDPKTPNADKETSSLETAKEDPNDLNNTNEKTLKKPDKILPCPRCNSMDTKFCYYNNYNISQPRHFCKSCQRYWTAGGTMRSVPVGSGRRKNKSSTASHYRHISFSEAVQANAENGIPQPNDSVLKFGSDLRLCESMSSSLILAEKSQNFGRNRFRGHDQNNLVSYRGGESVVDHSSGSSSAVANPTEKRFGGGSESVVTNNVQGSPAQVPCFPMTPWPCQWNSAPWRPPLAQAFAPSGYPISFYPVPPYWGCNAPNTLNVPWVSPQTSTPADSIINSQTLGKHSRDGSMLRPSKLTKEDPSEENETERGVLIPKTLRINDPNEAAKSSIWSTLGIKTENTDSGTVPSIFKAFLPKSTEKNHTIETSPALQANPAAMSRSLNFQETT